MSEEKVRQPQGDGFKLTEESLSSENETSTRSIPIDEVVEKAQKQGPREDMTVMIKLEPPAIKSRPQEAIFSLEENNAKQTKWKYPKYENGGDEAATMQEGVVETNLGDDVAADSRENTKALILSGKHNYDHALLSADSELQYRVEAAKLVLQGSVHSSAGNVQPLVTTQDDTDGSNGIFEDEVDPVSQDPPPRSRITAALPQQQGRTQTPGAESVYPSHSSYLSGLRPEVTAFNDDLPGPYPEVAESLVNISATVVEEEDIFEATMVEDPSKERRRLQLYLTGVILLLVIVLAVVVPIIVTQTTGNEALPLRRPPPFVNNATASSTTFFPSLSPSLTISPSQWPSLTPSVSPTSVLQALLAANSLDGGMTLTEMGSPQQRAFATIQEEILRERGMSMERILQRYAMETLYFATEGLQWTNRWKIEAVDTIRTPGGRFVSNECTWHGVVCNSNSSVVAVNLTNNDLFGTLPNELMLLTQLTLLHLSVNTLQQSIPLGLQRMSNLEALDLSDNRLESGFSSEMGLMTSLQYLSLSRNDALVWRLPTEIGFLTELRSIVVEATQLAGKLVSEVGLLTDLTALSLAHNQVTGTIPTELGQLLLLARLGLNNNQLTGTIPTQMGRLVQLTQLELNNNRLVKTIPSELGQLVLLTRLTLQDNLLTGRIPSELGFLTNLDTLTFNALTESNNFTGTVPQPVCDILGPSFLGLGCFSNVFLTACPCDNFVCPPPICAR